MNRRVVSGTIAALAAILLAGGSTTLGAFDDNTDIPANRVGAGVLQLDLGGGTAHASLTFTNIEPSDTATRRLWVVSNDTDSTMSGAVAMSIGSPQDVPGPCSTSRGKALGDIASGINGCVLTSTGATGTPEIGVASRLLAFDVSVTPVADPVACAERHTRVLGAAAFRTGKPRSRRTDERDHLA